MQRSYCSESQNNSFCPFSRNVAETVNISYWCFFANKMRLYRIFLISVYEVILSDILQVRFRYVYPIMWRMGIISAENTPLGLSWPLVCRYSLMSTSVLFCFKLNYFWKL